MTRIYEATWDESYDVASARTVPETYFHADNGYDAADIQRIETLQVGEMTEIDGRHHTVKRIA
jgi:hypothetical protein